jgi:hypothetical protein
MHARGAEGGIDAPCSPATEAIRSATSICKAPSTCGQCSRSSPTVRASASSANPWPAARVHMRLATLTRVRASAHAGTSDPGCGALNQYAPAPARAHLCRARFASQSPGCVRRPRAARRPCAPGLPGTRRRRARERGSDLSRAAPLAASGPPAHAVTRRKARTRVAQDVRARGVRQRRRVRRLMCARRARAHARRARARARRHGPPVHGRHVRVRAAAPRATQMVQLGAVCCIQRRRGGSRGGAGDVRDEHSVAARCAGCSSVA